MKQDLQHSQKINVNVELNARETAFKNKDLLEAFSVK